MTSFTYWSVPYKTLRKYLQSLVGRFFKIIPMWECNEKSLREYMIGFEADLMGSMRFIEDIDNDGMFVSLASSLEYLISNPDLNFDIVKKTVFNAISICKSLEKKYCVYDECIQGGERNG